MSEARAIRVHPADNVIVATARLPAGAELAAEDGPTLVVRDDIPAGHKVAAAAIAAGQPVIKYGFPIGAATEGIRPGDWVHSHNLRTRLEGDLNYRYEPAAPGGPAPSDDPRPSPAPVFSGYRRANGRVGTRNEVWIVPTVGCVNRAAERIASSAMAKFESRIDGVHAFPHPYGCSQLGDDLENTRRILAGLVRHPNAGGVLVLGLGCENNQLEALLARAGAVDRRRLSFFNSQEVLDEVEQGLAVVEQLVERMAEDEREECPASDLLLGMKCGGSDGFSGISANPLVGRIADRVTDLGGGAILTEVPEMFGAEQLLMNRAADEVVFGRIVELINGFKQYFRDHDQPIYENPSPGNKDGGLTTLEEKSLGATQKGGGANVTSVLRYSDLAPSTGLSLLESPGNDGVSSTAMVASGATVLLFTTGRGTPLGFPVPTIKISSNTAIAEKKPHWIDFNGGVVLDGAATLDEAAEALFSYVLDVASGRERTNNEKYDYREIAIWKEGVTL